MSGHDETIATIRLLRDMGAKRVRVGDVEVAFVGAPVESTEATTPRTLEQAQADAKQANEDLLFAASG